MINKLNLPRWFKNRLATIMKHNEFSEEMLTVEECDKRGKWTPVDLIIREYLNNGGGSAQGFLGITPNECCKCYSYIVENGESMVKLGLVHEDGWNNSGCILWRNNGFY